MAASDLFNGLNKCIVLLMLVPAGFSLMTMGCGLDRAQSVQGAEREVKNGFDLSRHSIPPEEIISGGPPRDGIPAIMNPKFVSARHASFLGPEDRVLGIFWGKEAKAYPILILNWHEIVNDTIDGSLILITYCPLCGTGMAFDPVTNGKKLTFGVSGLLYNSALLLYDHQTESLWSQIRREAVTGRMIGTRLSPFFVSHTTWGEWRREHPETLVLSKETGFLRDYNRDPYSGYEKSPLIMFSVVNRDGRFHPKEWVLGIELEGVAKAYPFSELRKKAGPLHDLIAGREITIRFNEKGTNAEAWDEKGRPLPSQVSAFWFAWYAFHPDTLVYTAGG